MTRSNQPIITLTTDFGWQDGYVGALQGVILSICPAATLVSLSHDIPPQDIRAAAFILYQAFSYYPLHTIHCVVVDPGVGSDRRAVAMRTNCGTFVGPDNGVLSLVLSAEGAQTLELVSLANPIYQLPQVSPTFHGRDIFAPAAAHIANGLPLRELGPPIEALVRLPERACPQNGGCRVLHIDRFGNLILDLTRHEIEDPRTVMFMIGNKMITSLNRTFTDVEEGELLAYTGSSRDHIEIAIRNGNAAKQLGVLVGDIVQVKQVRANA